ncbi:His-Xaa-Ser system protein HxsD [Mucilaginibacter corticis]|uniref:His-Xaa-Ser system protein HxsD n=1 Tax=Mucilaginibacter corticis TaxID=2597670 RepID=A0A556M4X5_9SPHI|nr:His-Xaa-Ser system protein HxsD [Mucilaginibacter corticis]TSJ34929.1 His-Xaa-Ser system protein HxsD [Mucilaginibacter corticis]
MENQNHIEGNSIFAYADERLFSKEAIFKCLYWYGDHFHTTVNINDGYYQLQLTTAQEISREELKLFLQKLERDLIDFNLRDMVSKETQNVRDLLIAKAFSNGELDEDPPGEISDPVGFSVYENKG